MADSYQSPLNPLPAVDALTELPLAGEPATDKAFETPNGTKFRVRLVKMDERAAHAPVNGEAEVAPSATVLSLSLALLADDGSVATDDAGRLLIMDRHEIIVDDEMANAASFETNIDLIIRQQAHELERRLTNRATVASYLNQNWGGTM